ncbi:hypothetical protein E6Q11_00195 [Candidatus Dojkabacteria bacterium]|uniref:Uncharacterized protein n=1 Tax=Candidatus Dojkabacteria bacterium TaxID=2099670 RepID=A0A5C7JCY8_9BACT|nr:MAG: hypothetical protein E6Q11_00195 [Candidatus Dojkabacteria bacterium]
MTTPTITILSSYFEVLQHKLIRHNLDHTTFDVKCQAGAKHNVTRYNSAWDHLAYPGTCKYQLLLEIGGMYHAVFVAYDDIAIPVVLRHVLQISQSMALVTRHMVGTSDVDVIPEDIQLAIGDVYMVGYKPIAVNPDTMELVLQDAHDHAVRIITDMDIYDEQLNKYV